MSTYNIYKIIYWAVPIRVVSQRDRLSQEFVKTKSDVHHS